VIGSENGRTVAVFVGDDWAEDHHDIELMDGSGRRLAKARLPEGVTGMARLHAMIGNEVGEDVGEDVEVLIGIRPTGSLGGRAGRGRLHGVGGQSGAGRAFP
jgi:hypothetical protein